MPKHFRDQTAPMYQTMVPYVDIYIRNKDILTSRDRKPRTLLSFSFSETTGANIGEFSFEIFDPDYVAVEELILATGTSGIDVSGEIYDAAGDNPAPKDTLAPIYFRFGYTGHEGTVTKPAGGGFFTGFVDTYTPTMATNGVQLTITGVAMGASPAKHYKKRVLPKTYNMSLYDTVLKVCDLMDWDFKSINDGGLKLPIGQQPEDLWDCSQGIETTEEQHKAFKMKDNETALQFIERISQGARSQDPQFGLYTFTLEYIEHNPGSPDPPRGVLSYGPQKFDQYPVRRYVFMRDAASDVISFAPTILGVPFSLVGGSGFVHKTENPETGDPSIKIKNEPNRYLAYFTDGRSTRRGTDGEMSTIIGRPQDGEFARGFIESEKYKNNIEGTNTGPQTRAPQEAHHVDDEVILEVSTRETGKMNGDRQAMNHFFATQLLASTATIEVFGDPSPELQPLKHVTVFVLVPVGDGGQFRMHYTSNIYFIESMHHQISGGTYITTLQLSRNGFLESGTASKALFTELEDLMGSANSAGIV